MAEYILNTQVIIPRHHYNKFLEKQLLLTRDCLQSDLKVEAGFLHISKRILTFKKLPEAEK